MLQQSVLFVIVFLLTVITASTAGSSFGLGNTLANVPAEWQKGVLGADIFYSPIEPEDYMPEVGNGYWASQMNSEYMYVAGVFNGADPPNKENVVPHRASIPSTINSDISIVPLSTSTQESKTNYTMNGTAVDIRKGLYIRRFTQSTDKGVIYVNYYAHRTMKHVGVLHVQGANLSSAVQLTFSSESKGSDDINFVTTEKNLTLQTGKVVLVTIWKGQTKTPEIPGKDPTEVVVVTIKSRTLEVTQREPSAHVVTSVCTSVDNGSKRDTETRAIEAFVEAASFTPEELLGRHIAGWTELWKSGFEIEGSRIDVAKAVNSSLYYLLSSARNDTIFSLSPGGLASNAYNGHTFWDTETWMFPSLLMWHPSIARSLLQYRADRLDAAKKKARSYDPPYQGTMFPWESANEGTEACPPAANTGEYEQHISGDIVFAVRQYYLNTKDKSWLQSTGMPVAEGVADFWVSRIKPDSAGAGHIYKVVPPDEYAFCNDSVYTNYVAKLSLEFATNVSNNPNPQWQKASSSLVQLFDEAKQYHPEYDGYQQGTKIKQADVVLLGFPLMVPMSKEVRANDLKYYASVTDENGPAMTWGMHAIGYLDIGDAKEAAANFNRSFANSQPPFGVWSETPNGGAVNFLTGLGGYLQTILFGYAGLRLTEDKLQVTPSLVEGASKMHLRGIHYAQAVFSFMYNNSAQGKFKLETPSCLGRLMIVEFDQRLKKTTTTPLTMSNNVEVNFQNQIHVEIEKKSEAPKSEII